MKKKIIIALTTCVFSIVIGWTCLYSYVSTHHRTQTTQGLIAAKSIDELILDSDVIIKGKVNKSMDSKWSNPEKKPNKRNVITTDIIIDIEAVYKGIPYDNKNIAVRIGKGTIGKDKLISEGYPDFKNNEEVTLFLSKDDSDIATNENYYVLTGMRQGKFELKNKTVYSSGRDTIDSQNIKQLIDTTIENEKRNPRNKMSKEEIKKINEKAFGPDVNDVQSNPTNNTNVKDEPAKDIGISSKNELAKDFIKEESGIK